MSRSWQVVALSSEVADEPFAVQIGGTGYALFRDGDGMCRAVLDRCAHRRAPLSLGRVKDGLIQCPYHGWAFDGANGACRAIPNLGTNQKIPAAYKVPALAVSERDGWIAVAAEAHSEWTGHDCSDEAEGRVTLAFPAPLLIDALLDSPTAFLDVRGLTIFDDHPLGDPVPAQGGIVARYAAAPARLVRQEKVLADFPFTLSIAAPAGEGIVDIDLTAAQGVSAGRVSAAIVARDDRLADIVWRSSALSGTPRFREAPQAAALVRAKRYISAARDAVRQTKAA